MGNNDSPRRFAAGFFIRAALCGCLLILSAMPGFAASLEELLGPERAAALSSRGTLTEAQHGNPRPRMVPSDSAIRNLIDETVRDLGPSVSVETLQLYQKPAGAQSGAWSGAERAALYNETLALSTLAGLEYFSASRGRMRVFYETSAVIDGPDTKNPRPDPRYASPPEELRIYARQKDLTFGDNIYQYDYFAGTGTLIFVQKNLSTMTYGIIPVVGKGKLRSLVAVIDAGEYLLIYAASLAKAASLPGMNQRVEASFSTRAGAVLGWFSGRADRAFETANPR
jgi:hypothetical protein